MEGVAVAGAGAGGCVLFLSVVGERGTKDIVVKSVVGGGVRLGLMIILYR